MIVTPPEDAIAAALRKHRAISDASFDRLFPPSQRFNSRFHWTPVEVAVRACSLLAAEQGRKVLDVGCGAGKLCHIGALTTRARWIGIERDGRMIEVARQVAERLGIEHRVEFVQGDATAIDWSTFDAIYLFNPFAEYLFDADADALARRERYVGNVERAQQRLSETAVGTRVVTFHGIGGDMPEGFELTHREGTPDALLCLWTRTTARRLPRIARSSVPDPAP